MRAVLPFFVDRPLAADRRCPSFGWAILLAVVCSLLFLPEGAAQKNRRDLEKRRESLKGQVRATQQLLDEARKNRTAMLDELIVLEAQMEQRMQLVEILGQEAELLESTIAGHSTAVLALERDLAKAREDCAVLVRAAWRQRSKMGLWMRLFDSSGLRDLWLRWRTLTRFFAYRNRQFSFLRNTKQILAEKVDELNLRRQEYLERLAEFEAQRKVLAGEVEEKNGLVKKLKRDEQRLAREAKDLEASQQATNRMIEDVIHAEAEKAKARARKPAEADKPTAQADKGVKGVKKGARRPAPVNDELPLNQAESHLALSFRENRGKLPWPVDNGVVAAKFGLYAHPEFPSVKLNNLGIDIKTNQGATVYTVFEGVVVSTFVLPGSQQAVIVQHGNFFTTYTNLATVAVKEGQSLSTRTPIGTVYTDGNGLAQVHFEVWNNKIKEDPEKWLKKR